MKKSLRIGISTVAILILLGLLATGAAYLYVRPMLPDIEVLKDVRLQVPLRIYARDGGLMAEYGKMKRAPLRYAEIPPLVVDAFVSAEDDRFFEHPGVDYQGLIRAFLHLVATGHKGQGGSTITMQVARNYFLSPEKTYLRKIIEIFLSLKIEHELTKQDILELYLNKIYLGQRAYGVAAAAQVYYGKDVQQLTLAEIAMVAGLPKAPSSYNPVANPTRALARRNYVLGRMHDLGYIDSKAYNEAIAAPITATVHSLPIEVDAPYVAEMVRADMVDRYGEAAYSAGYNVYTTIDPKLQAVANKALHDNLLAYDQRHGYRGAEAHLELPAEGNPDKWGEMLEPYGSVGGLKPALVISTDGQTAQVYVDGVGLRQLDWDGVQWARAYVDENTMGPVLKEASDVLKPGDVIRVDQSGEDKWSLSEVPDVGGAVVSLNPKDGALLGLVGGFDFYKSKFNRVTQAQRQPGSNFKPFIYSAALDKGFTAASLINDAPVVFDDAGLEAEWRPENYSGSFFGPTRLREALIHSRNLVSIRLLRAIGVDYAINYLKGFGFDTSRLPHDLSLALGSAAVTPWELIRGYAVIANGGFLVNPYYITRIVDVDGNTVFADKAPIACNDKCMQERQAEIAAATPTTGGTAPAESQATNPAPAMPAANSTATNSAPGAAPATPAIDLPPLAPRTKEARNIYLITTMMQDVIKHGTGRRALVLNRNDLAGKTGTTNDQRDAWFSGFQHDIVTTAWVGFDSPRPLGSHETGAHAALPIWIDVMRAALQGVPEHLLEEPPGLVTYRIDADTGELANAQTKNPIFETFRTEYAPKPSAAAANSSAPQNGDAAPSDQNANDVTGNLF